MTEVKAWRLAHGRSLELGATARIMGILNVTPDSFSDGGRYTGVDTAIAQALKMVEEGASIIDVGGESTRPGAEPVSPEEEQLRALPVIEALRDTTSALISIDSYRAETARLAVAAGAHIVNDVWGLQRDPDMARVATEVGAGLVIMHTGREREKLPDIIADEFAFLRRSLAIAADHGLHSEQIVLDPGFGFAKDAVENGELMARFGELATLGLPWLVGTSRKRFLGVVSGREPAERDVSTAASSVALRLAGAHIFRVHNVTMNKDALAVADAILAARPAKAEAGGPHG